jgi:hypothetical protein
MRSIAKGQLGRQVTASLATGVAMPVGAGGLVLWPTHRNKLTKALATAVCVSLYVQARCGSCAIFFTTQPEAS